MPKTILSTFNKADSKLSVTLHNCAFSKNGERYIRVSRNTVTLENMIADILSENRGLDPFMIQHAATLLQQQILKMLSLGNSVNFLDLGTLYIAMKGLVQGEKISVSDLPDFQVRFTPGSLVQEAVSNLSVDKVVLAETGPQINYITDLWTGTRDSELTVGKPCLVNGKNLKLGGDETSLSFIMVTDTGDEIENQDPINVDLGKVFTNTPRKLSFFVPDSLVKDTCYKIRICTCYLGKDRSRKTPVYTESSFFKVV